MISFSCTIYVYSICVRGSTNKDISSMILYTDINDFFMDTPHIWTFYNTESTESGTHVKITQRVWINVPSVVLFSLSSCVQYCDENRNLTEETFLCSVGSGCHLDHHKATLAESRALHGEGLGGAGVSLVEVIVIIVVGHPETSSIWNNPTRSSASFTALTSEQRGAPQIKGWLWPRVSKAKL